MSSRNGIDWGQILPTDAWDLFVTFYQEKLLTVEDCQLCKQSMINRQLNIQSGVEKVKGKADLDWLSRQIDQLEIVAIGLEYDDLYLPIEDQGKVICSEPKKNDLEKEIKTPEQKGDGSKLICVICTVNMTEVEACAYGSCFDCCVDFCDHHQVDCDRPESPETEMRNMIPSEQAVVEIACERCGNTNLFDDGKKFKLFCYVCKQNVDV